MEKLIWRNITVKYNNDVNTQKDVTDYLEEIYKYYSDVFENVKTVNLTNPDYMFIGRKRYVCYGLNSRDGLRLNYYSPNEL